MRLEAQVLILRTRVRTADLPRHAVLKLDHGRTFAWSTGLGLPRTWHLTTGAALQGAEESLESTRALEPLERLTLALASARTTLTSRCETLLDSTSLDATLHVLLVEHDSVHVGAVGPGRVYVYRGKEPKRLTPREEPHQGLLHATPFVCSLELRAGDLVLAGSPSAFSMPAIAKVASALEKDASTAPAALASIMTEPAAQGIGALALAARLK